MGDFVGALLKYLRTHPVSKLTLAGGFAKMAKLSQGALDLHSSRSSLDMAALASVAASAGCDPLLLQSVGNANTALEALQLASCAGVDLAAPIAHRAWENASRALGDSHTALELLVFNREGLLLARADK